MITLKYVKQEALIYVSHIDLLRHVERTLRRADLPVAYSQGYNPHMLVNLGITLPLGVASEAEYLTVDVDVDPRTFLAKYNRSAHDGLRGLTCWRVPKNPNLAGTVVAADYRMAAPLGDKARAVQGLTARTEYVIPYPTKKDAAATKDVAPLIYALQADANGVSVCMAAGNTTVRPQVLADAIGAEFGVEFAPESILRRHQYVRREGVLYDVDKMLGEIAEDSAHV